MKKLLLLVVPLLLFFGVSLGKSTTYNIPCTVGSHGSQSQGSAFMVGSPVTLTAISWQYIVGARCGYVVIYSGGVSNPIYSGESTSNENLTGLSIDLVRGVSYRITWFLNSGLAACQCVRCDSPVVYNHYFSGDFLLVFGYWNSSTQAPANNYFYQLKSITLSGADTLTTIHYNGITTGYAGTDIYIDQPVKETYLSGGFLHFVVQRFRTLFRRHP